VNFHQHLYSDAFWSALWMTVSYILYFIADGLIIYTSFRRKTYGQPPIPAALLLGSSLAALIGPFTDQRHLFYDLGAPGKSQLPAVWAFAVLVQFIIFAQYFVYGRGPAPVSRGRFVAAFFSPWVLLSTLAAFVFSWTYIVFYQDFYVNEIFALVTLLMTVGYVGSLSADTGLRGMPVAGAWCYTGAITFAEIGTYVGGMEAAYPDARHGYAFIYFCWILASILLGWYAWGLGRPRAPAAQPRVQVPG
jgi:hypothetical protein